MSLAPITHEERERPAQVGLALVFPLFTLLALGVDSPYFRQHYFDGRQLANVMAIGYFGLMYRLSGSYLRKLMLVMVPLSYIGELIFCKLLHMYDYSESAIPVYVPFGHAIVYASGFVYAHTAWAAKHDEKLQLFFKIFFLLLFVGAGIFLNDIFTVVSGMLFFVLLKRKRWQNLYCFIALCVIFIELAGTGYGCWSWRPEIFGMVPAANPPLGAVFFYAGGDVLLVKIVDAWQKAFAKK